MFILSIYEDDCIERLDGNKWKCLCRELPPSKIWIMYSQYINELDSDNDEKGEFNKEKLEILYIYSSGSLSSVISNFRGKYIFTSPLIMLSLDVCYFYISSL